MVKSDVWTPVQVSNPAHARAGQAGVVYANHPDHPTETAVRFDTDGAIVLVALDDLKAL